MKIIFCGPIYDVNLDKEVPSASPAAGRFLTNLCNAFEKHNQVQLVRAIYFSYEKLTDINIQNIQRHLPENAIFSYFKNGNLLTKVLKYQKDILSEVDCNSFVVLYNMFYGYWELQKRIEKKGGKCVLFFADHTPHYEEHRIINKLYALINEHYLSTQKNIISLVKNPTLPFNNTKFLHLYGGIKTEDYSNFSIVQNNKPVFMYSGLLSKVTGVNLLLDAIKHNTQKDIIFRISGKGELINKVVNLSKIDFRVEYLGYLNERDFLERLNEADVLINPRDMLLPQNNNNFPSKVLEYLATGKIIISTRFRGYEDFAENIIFFDGNSISLNRNIELVLKDFEANKKDYFRINREKSLNFEWETQVDKIFHFLNSI